MEQTDDEIDEEETTAGDSRAVSIAVHAQSKKDGSGAQEFHLQLDKDSMPVDVDSKDNVVKTSATFEVSTEPTTQTKVLLSAIM